MKKLMSLICLLILTACLSGCGSDKSSDEKQYDTYIYYLNSQHTDLIRSGVDFGSKEGQELADEIADRLAVSSDTSDVSPLPAGVVIEKAEVRDRLVHVHLNKLYEQVAVKDQVLCRCALVESFMQIPQVSGVNLYVGSEPMTDENGNAYKTFTFDDFLFTSSKIPGQTKNVTLNLYFSTANGKRLKKEAVPVTVESDESLVRVILEKLIDGPSYEEENAVISHDTKILGVSVMENTAYIDLSSEFADDDNLPAPDLSVYSVVNSVIDNTDIKRVQILIEGKAPASYGGSLDLRRPLRFSRSYIK